MPVVSIAADAWLGNASAVFPMSIGTQIYPA